MLLTITEYSKLARDENGNVLPLGDGRLASTAKTAVGTHVLNNKTRFIRFATDTVVQCAMDGTETAAGSELILANTTEFFAVKGGTTLDIEASPAS